VCSSIVYARILQQLGYDARPAVQGKINSETAYILKTAGVETPEQILDAAGKNVVLIDHSELLQSVDGISDANIIGIIDHHSAGSITSDNPMIYDARPVGSSATIAWIRARNYGVEIDASMAALMFAAMMSDTSDLKSQNTTSADRAAYEELPKIAGIEDPEAFCREMFKASLSYNGMSDMEIMNSDIKDYEAGGRTFAIGSINAYDDTIAMDLANRMKVLLQDVCAEHGVEMSYAQISIFHDDLSVCYIVPSDETAAEVLEAAFPDGGYSFDGTSYVFRPGMSRRQTLVPAITNVLTAHPGE
ncbi:MAG: DHH family phosphoesterase, partial [Anaerolineaceae bacterium]|nr:DHH family phosphoesterase [Anaerolineaceae bacterium]